jgi:hypothetical protein
MIYGQKCCLSVGPPKFLISVSLAQNGAGLGAMWGKEKAIEVLKNSGFTNVEVKTLAHDFQNYYYIAMKT